MAYAIDEQVVHPAYGIGRITGLVSKKFSDGPARQYYEIAIDKGVVWVGLEAEEVKGLRPLTPKGELVHYRTVLRSRPVALNVDHRQRRLDLGARLRGATFQDTCEIVRDITARGWHKTLSELDNFALRKARDGLCQEWAAAEGVTVLQAIAEVNTLLLESRQAYRV